MTKLKNKDAERLNPCLKEQEMSYQCLSKNGYDNSKCEDYFDNYNTCKKFWKRPQRADPCRGCGLFVRDNTPPELKGHMKEHGWVLGKVYHDRKAKGQYPYMPEVEDRARIKEQYFKSVKDSFM